MKVIAAYLLAVLGGNTSPSAADLKKILSSVGADADADDNMIELLLSQVKGKDVTELIAPDNEKLASVPADGGGGVAVVAFAGGATEERKEEKKVEENEEFDEYMGFNLFD